MRPKAFTCHFTSLAYPQGVLTSRLTIIPNVAVSLSCPPLHVGHLGGGKPGKPFFLGLCTHYFKATLAAHSKSSCTPTLVFTEVSKFTMAPICLENASPYYTLMIASVLYLK